MIAGPNIANVIEKSCSTLNNDVVKGGAERLFHAFDSARGSLANIRIRFDFALLDQTWSVGHRIAIWGSRPIQDCLHRRTWALPHMSSLVSMSAKTRYAHASFQRACSFFLRRRRPLRVIVRNALGIWSADALWLPRVPLALALIILQASFLHAAVEHRYTLDGGGVHVHMGTLKAYCLPPWVRLFGRRTVT
jgi:hypothetical protein